MALRSCAPMRPTRAKCAAENDAAWPLQAPHVATQLVPAAELAALRQRAEAAERFLEAIRWALGTRGEFRPQMTMDGLYWWRGELAERAGLVYDGANYIVRAAAAMDEGRPTAPAP